MSKKSKEVNERRLEHKGEVVSRRKKEKCIFTESSEILLDIFMPEYYIDYLKLNENQEITQKSYFLCLQRHVSGKTDSEKVLF